LCRQAGGDAVCIHRAERRRNSDCPGALIGVLAVSLSLRAVFPRITGSQQLASGRSGPVSLPWVFREVSNGDRLTLTVPIGWLTPQRWDITPDDSLRSLRINGQIVPLDTVRPGGLRGWEDGFEMDLSQWLHHGENTLEFTVDNHDGIGGISLRSRPVWGALLLAASLLPWLLALARLFRLRRSQTLILCLALLVLYTYRPRPGGSAASRLPLAVEVSGPRRVTPMRSSGIRRVYGFAGSKPGIGRAKLHRGAAERPARRRNWDTGRRGRLRRR